VIVLAGWRTILELFILGDNRTADNYHPSWLKDAVIHVYRSKPRTWNINYTVETWTAQENFDSLTNSSTVSAMELYSGNLTLAHNETRFYPSICSCEKRI
jgi:hypothetical protein